MLPTELARHQVDNRAELLLHVDPDLFWFRGHFPDQPLLPGVAQLDWVMHYGILLLAPNHHFAAVENIKFQQPILPGSTLCLRMSWLAEKRQLTFSYARVVGASETVASSGKIGLC